MLSAPVSCAVSSEQVLPGEQQSFALSAALWWDYLEVHVEINAAPCLISTAKINKCHPPPSSSNISRALFATWEVLPPYRTQNTNKNPSDPFPKLPHPYLCIKRTKTLFRSGNETTSFKQNQRRPKKKWKRSYFSPLPHSSLTTQSLNPAY